METSGAYAPGKPADKEKTVGYSDFISKRETFVKEYIL